MAKDIFGKRSLLLGFHQNGFSISSCATKINMNKVKFHENKEENEDEGDKQESIEKKYLGEFISAKDKEWVDLPSN